MEKIIAPSLLAANFLNLQKEIEELELTNAKWLHLDVMDGNFVPNISFGFDIIKQIRGISKLYLDVHLMITSPLSYIDKCKELKVDGITFHLEVKEDVNKIISKIKENDIDVGIAVNPETPINDIDEYLKLVDLVLVMSVHPGFGGQRYMSEVEKKVEYLVRLREEKGYKYKIQIDGGINENTAKSAITSGVDILVAGSYVFEGNKEEKVNSLVEEK